LVCNHLYHYRNQLHVRLRTSSFTVAAEGLLICELFKQAFQVVSEHPDFVGVVAADVFIGVSNKTVYDAQKAFMCDLAAFYWEKIVTESMMIPYFGPIPFFHLLLL